MRVLVIAAVAALLVAFAGAGTVVAANHDAGSSRERRALRADVHHAVAGSPSPSPKAGPEDRQGADEQSDADEQSEDANEDAGDTSRSKIGQNRQEEDQRRGAANAGDSGKRD